MSSVIAVVTEDSAAEAVVSTARAVAELFGARVEALHVGAERVALSAAATGAGMTIKQVSGETVESLARAASIDDVAALVIGARGQRSGKCPAGSIALQVITLGEVPVVVVPPDGPAHRTIESVLVPLDGTRTSAAALSEVVELAHQAALQIVVAHVYTSQTLPAFDDHVPHETRAWSEEFLAREVSAATGAKLELRVDGSPEHLLAILRESSCDLVALGWRQDLARGRAAVVRRMLAESPVPVLLTPVKRPTARSPARPAERATRYRASEPSP
jgi:nucleotide-binding universal stress UspA family protein